MISPVPMPGKAAVMRNGYGVVLRYEDGGDLKPFHVERKIHRTDTERAALLKAERELLTLRIIADHIEISDIGLTRIEDALGVIQHSLALTRVALDMRAPA